MTSLHTTSGLFPAPDLLFLDASAPNVLGGLTPAIQTMLYAERLLQLVLTRLVWCRHVTNTTKLGSCTTAHMQLCTIGE